MQYREMIYICIFFCHTNKDFCAFSLNNEELFLLHNEELRTRNTICFTENSARNKLLEHALILNIQTCFDQDNGDDLRSILMSNNGLQTNTMIDGRSLITVAIEKQAWICLEMLLRFEFIATADNLRQMESIELELKETIRTTKHCISHLSDKKKKIQAIIKNKKDAEKQQALSLFVSAQQEQKKNELMLAQLSRRQENLKKARTRFITLYYGDDQFNKHLIRHLMLETCSPVYQIAYDQKCALFYKIKDAIVNRKQRLLHRLLRPNNIKKTGFNINEPFCDTRKTNENIAEKINPEKINAETLLDHAINKRNIIAIRLLIRLFRKAGYNPKHTLAWQLQKAICQNNLELAKYILETLKVKANDISINRSTPLSIAIGNGNPSMVFMLLNHGITITAQDVEKAEAWTQIAAGSIEKKLSEQPSDIAQIQNDTLDNAAKIYIYLRAHYPLQQKSTKTALVGTKKS